MALAGPYWMKRSGTSRVVLSTAPREGAEDLMMDGLLGGHGRCKPAAWGLASAHPTCDLGSLDHDAARYVRTAVCTW